MIKLHEECQKIELTGQWNYGNNEAKCEFTCNSQQKDKKIFLSFENIFGVEEILVNHVYLGKQEGYAHLFEVDVTDHISCGEKNILIIKMNTQEDGTPHFWEEHVKLVIRQNIYIEYCKIFTKTVLKKDSQSDGHDRADGSALVCLDVTLHNMSNNTVVNELSALIRPHNFLSDEKFRRSRKVVLPPGRTTVKLTLTVANAKLWWTWDHGYPHLYELKLGYAEDSTDMKFGIKDIIYDEKLGNRYLNGKKIFLRGVSYNSQMGIKQADEKQYRQDIEAIAAININSILVESPIEKEELYTCCDELGILVWQVFPQDVQEDNELISSKAELIRAVGMKLTNHACLGMWSVGSEILKETLSCIDPVRWVHLLTDKKDGTNFMQGACTEENSNPKDYMIPPNVLGTTEYKLQEDICVKEELEYIRQHKYFPVSAMYLHEWKSVNKVIGCGYTRIFISMEACMDSPRLGKVKEFKKGTTFTARVWVINDDYDAAVNSEIKWKVIDMETNETVAAHNFKRTIQADSVEIPDHIVLPLKECFAGHRFRVLMSVISEDADILSENFSEFRVTE